MAMSKGAKVAVGAGIAGLIVTVIGLVASRKAGAAPPPEPPPEGMAKLYGRVTNAQTGNGISGVKVTTTGAITMTDSAGNYATIDIPPGSWGVRFEKDGYETKELTMSILEGNNELNVQLVPTGGQPPAENLEITDITVTPTELTDTEYEYNTSLGLGYWGDLFTISITFKNPFDKDIWVKPDYALGLLTGDPLKYVGNALQGFDAKKLLYFRLLLQSEYIEGDYSYTTDWQKPWDPKGQNKGSNMVLGIYDPDGVPQSVGAADYWLKIPPKGSVTMVKEAHLGRGISSLAGVYDLCVAGLKVWSLVYDPGYGTQRVGGQTVVVNWRPVELAPVVVVIPEMVNIGGAPEAVTIDVLEVKINYTTRSASLKVAITNHTDQTIPGTNKFWVKAYYGERFVRPARGRSAAVTYEKGDEMVLLYSTTQTTTIGSLPPGTTIKTFSYSDGFGSIIYTNDSHVVTAYPLAIALPEGLKAYAWVHFGAPDGVPIADTDAGFKGELSSQLVPFVPTPVEIRWVSGDWYSYWQAYFPE